MPDVFDVVASACLIVGVVSFCAGKDKHATAAAMFALATFNVVAKIATVVVP